MTFGITARAYRWYEDGTETGAAAIAAQDTAITRLVTSNSPVVLRYGVQESGSASTSGASTDDYQLQYSKNGGAFTSVTGATTNVQGFTSSSLTDAATTTSRLSAGTGAFVAGRISETDGLLTDWLLTANNYSDLLYAIQIIAADTAEGDVFTFRVLRNGAVFNTYSVTPSLTVTKIQAFTADISETVTITESTAAVYAATTTEPSETVTITEAVGEVYTSNNGTAYFGDVSETLAITESIVTGFAAVTAPSESISLSESTAVQILASASVAESAALSESLNSLAAFAGTATESVALTESMSGGLALTAAVSESVTLSDSIAATSGAAASLAEAAALTESVAGPSAFAAPVGENVTASESVTAGVPLTADVAESVAVSEGIAAAEAPNVIISCSVDDVPCSVTVQTGGSSVET